MPHITIKCYKGRNKQELQKCADAVAKAVSETLGLKISSISLEIDEIEKDNWVNDIWDKEIEPNMDKLYIKPGYKPDNR